VLLSGDHAAIAAWRHQQRLERTASRRPDLLHSSAALGSDDLLAEPATASDAAELLTLQRACWVAEGRANGSFDIPPLVESLAEVAEGLRTWHTWVVRSGGRLVASVRGRSSSTDPRTWEIGRLMVAPDLQGRGLGRALLDFAERAAAPETTAFLLNTGTRSEANLRRYRRAGYRPLPGEGRYPGTVDLTKRRGG
jgi:tRNA (guanine37-N1)-methyltransferase